MIANVHIRGEARCLRGQETGEARWPRRQEGAAVACHNSRY